MNSQILGERYLRPRKIAGGLGQARLCEQCRCIPANLQAVEEVETRPAYGQDRQESHQKNDVHFSHDRRVAFDMARLIDILPEWVLPQLPAHSTNHSSVTSSGGFGKPNIRAMRAEGTLST